MTNLTASMTTVAEKGDNVDSASCVWLFLQGKACTQTIVCNMTKCSDKFAIATRIYSCQTVIQIVHSLRMKVLKLSTSGFRNS